MEMVQYWKSKDKVEAKVTKDKDGVIVMHMDGEKYPFPGFPRGHLLYGKLSKLKHEVKNQIFNDSWASLEAGVRTPVIIEHIKEKALPRIFELLEQSRYDMVPLERMVPAVKEIHRAWTKVAPGNNSLKLRDLICFILQEDDSYRFRVQWLVTYFNPNGWMRLFGNPITQFEYALTMLEHAEVIGDMKERIRLLRRVLMVVLSDPAFRDNFLKLCREVDWNKVKLSKADKYFFRGKYFKVDLDKFDY